MPNIIKKLIYVCKFITDNNCSIELDKTGLSMQDTWTHKMLLRCDSTKDLYPVQDLKSLPQAFISSRPTTWHQWLGHPESKFFVIRFLVI